MIHKSMNWFILRWPRFVAVAIAFMLVLLSTLASAHAGGMNPGSSAVGYNAAAQQTGMTIPNGWALIAGSPSIPATPIVTSSGSTYLVSAATWAGIRGAAPGYVRFGVVQNGTATISSFGGSTLNCSADAYFIASNPVYLNVSCVVYIVNGGTLQFILYGDSYQYTTTAAGVGLQLTKIN